MVFSLPQFVTRMLPAKFIPCKVGPVPPWCSQRREARERLGLIASSCVLGCLLFFYRGSSNTLGCRTDLHTSTWSAASQKNFPSCLEAESEGWHLLTFWANSPLFVGLKIHFRYLDTKTQNMTFFLFPQEQAVRRQRYWQFTKRGDTIFKQHINPPWYSWADCVPPREGCCSAHTD